MTVAQTLSHCCVTYEMIYDDKHSKAKGIKKFLLKSFLKPIVVGKKAYKKNSRTAPNFLIKEDKNFDVEKKRLVEYINKTQDLGEEYFQGKDSNSFGELSTSEWNNMLYKHLDHHLNQFGV
jgi:hypothetical protein